MERNVAALLCDFGNVLVEIDFGRAFQTWAVHASVAPDLIAQRFAFGEAYEAHERGEIEVDAYFAHLRTSLGIRISDEQFLEGWNAIFVGELSGLSNVLHRAAQRVPLYVFSNSNKAHELYWSARFAGILRHFKGVFVSSTIGMRKPETRAFHYVADAIGVPPANIVFLDDLIDNIEGARAAGLEAFHIKAPHDVVQIVESVL